MIFRQASKKWLSYLVYAILALAVLCPLLFPGYVLTLDMLFAPHHQFPGNPWGLEEGWTWISPVLPLYLLVQLANLIIPGWLIQKIVLFLILFFAGLGAHRLVGSGKAGAYFAGVLYVINPYTYVRFLAGQWAVLWAYALAPFAIAAFIQLLQQGGSRNAIKVALLATLLGLPHITGIFLLFLAYLVILIVWMIAERKMFFRMASSLRYVATSAGIFLALNLYWLVPVLTEKGMIVSQISQADLYFFAPKASSVFGVVFDTASMYGFWREAYITAKDILPFWWVLFVFILFLAVYGFLWKRDDKKQGWMTVAFSLIGAVSLSLAVGAASEISRRPFEWLWEQFSFFRGFRDSQKFVTLLCLTYAYLGGLGVNKFTGILRQQSKRLPMMGMAALIILALLTPIAYSFTMFGFHGQLGVTEYPKEWYEVNAYLNQDDNDFNVLVLPWHMYMDYSWLPNRDKRLANPGRQFFDKPVIAGDNVEVTGIDSQSTNPISKYVEFVLGNGGSIDNLGELLAPLNVKYVILVNEADYQSYDFLFRQKDISVVLEKPGITLFENEHATARAYEVDSLVYIDSLEEYLELSKTQDVMAHLYVIGSGQSDDGNTQMGKLTTNAKSPVNYQVEGATKQYTVFAVPQNVNTEYWEFNGQPPVAKNLGFMPAFTSSYDGGEIVYTRFYRVYLPCYIISALTLSLMVYLYCRSRKGRASGI